MILDGITIVELAQTNAPALSGLLLAEAGADVIIIDQPRRRAEKGDAGAALRNRGKKRVFLDLQNGDDHNKFRRLLARSDVLIHDLLPAQASVLKLDTGSLRAEFPKLVSSAVTPYPGNHPDKDRYGSDNLVLARLGLLDEQQGHRDGPVYIRFPLGTMGAAYLSAIGVLARLVQRQATGWGGAADTSLMQGALAPMAMHWAAAENPDQSFAAGMPKDKRPSLFECADGKWMHLMAAPDKCPTMQKMLQELGEDTVAKANSATQANRLFPNFGANAIAFLKHDRAYWLAELWAHDVPAQGVEPIGELFFDQQARDNDYVVTVDDPELGEVLQPGPPFEVTPSARAGHEASPPGADTKEILAWLEQGASDNNASYTAHCDRHEGEPPLRGLKLADFGNFLAGPFATMLLADLGADVIKVESQKGDPMRMVARAFSGCQRNKKSLAVDLTKERAGPTRDAVVKWADVVHHNLRENAAVKLGLDYERLSTINPDMVYCHVTAYGPKGERRAWPGYDQLFQAASGWEHEAGGEGNPPIWHRFGMMDHQCAMASAVATLLGVYHHRRTGKGQAVSASILGASLLTVNDVLVRPNGSVKTKNRVNRDQTGVSPGDRIYQCADGDWVAVEVADDELIRLCMVAREGGKNTLETYFLSVSQADAIKTVRASGGCVEPVRLDQCADFLASQVNLASRLCVELKHRDYGEIVQVGAFWNADNLPQKFDLAAPALGEHSIEILRSCKFPPETIEDLKADGVIV